MLGPINEFDNTLKIEKKMNNTFKGLVDTKELSKAIINELKPTGLCDKDFMVYPSCISRIYRYVPSYQW